jgi:hypothetical protein
VSESSALDSAARTALSQSVGPARATGHVLSGTAVWQMSADKESTRLEASMLSRQHSGHDRSYACNDNGRFSAAWNNSNPAGTCILAVAGRGGCTVGLTYVADGVLIIDSGASSEGADCVESLALAN